MLALESRHLKLVLPLRWITGHKQVAPVEVATIRDLHGKGARADNQAVLRSEAGIEFDEGLM